MLASIFNKRQRNKDKITAMRKGKALLWLLAGNTLKKDQITAIRKGRALLWLLAGNTLNSFLFS